jgi:hypothetical protein
MNDLPRNMRPKLSLEQEYDIIALYQQGYSIEKISPKYGICGQTVLNILERHGIRRRSISEESIQYLRDEHAFDEKTMKRPCTG